MKRIDFSYRGGKIEFHQESEEHLTAEQKYTIILTSIGCLTFCILAALFFWAVTH